MLSWVDVTFVLSNIHDLFQEEILDPTKQPPRFNAAATFELGTQLYDQISRMVAFFSNDTDRLTRLLMVDQWSDLMWSIDARLREMWLQPFDITS